MWQRKYTVQVSYPDDYGPFWMNPNNLALCLMTNAHVGDKVRIEVENDTRPIEGVVHPGCGAIVVTR